MSSENKTISWIKNLNIELDGDKPKISFIAEDFKKACGSSADCNSCPKYRNCYDFHCNVSDEKYHIDYIVSKLGYDVLVMIDDVFWHGLNRSEESISSPETVKDKLISEIFFRDKYFNKFCEEKNVPLVRFSSEDVSLFVMSRIELIEPHFTCGPKRKLKKFFDLYTKALDKFFGEIFEMKVQDGKRKII